MLQRRSTVGQVFRAVARDRLFLILIAANIVLVAVGPALSANILPPFATAHTPVGPGEIGFRFFLNTFFIVVAQIPATRVVKRMRRTHAFAATSGLWAIGLLAVLLATLTRSPFAATTVLAGVAIMIAIGECVQSIVLGPLVAEHAPPHLLGRYMALYSLTFTAGLALGPAVGGRGARNAARRRLVGRRLDGCADRSRLAATRRPGTRPALANAMRSGASGTRGDVTRRRMAGILEHAPGSAAPLRPIGRWSAATRSSIRAPGPGMTRTEIPQAARWPCPSVLGVGSGPRAGSIAHQARRGLPRPSRGWACEPE